MKIEVGINWPLASNVVICMAGAATAVPASCYSGCLHPERPLAGCWLEVLKPFSQARLWGQKPWFPEDSPSNHLNISQWSKPFVCAQPPPFLCRTAHWFPWRLQTSGIDRWLLADHGGLVDQTADFQTRTRLWLCTRRFEQKGELLSSTCTNPSESVWYLSLVHNLPVSLLSFLTLLCKVKMQKCHYCILRIAWDIF